MLENRISSDGSAYLDKPYSADIRPLTEVGIIFLVVMLATDDI